MFERQQTKTLQHLQKAFKAKIDGTKWKMKFKPDGNRIFSLILFPKSTDLEGVVTSHAMLGDYKVVWHRLCGDYTDVEAFDCTELQGKWHKIVPFVRGYFSCIPVPFNVCVAFLVKIREFQHFNDANCTVLDTRSSEYRWVCNANILRIHPPIHWLIH